MEAIGAAYQWAAQLSSVQSKIYFRLQEALKTLCTSQNLDSEKAKATTLDTIIKTLHSRSSMQAEHSKNVAQICGDIALAMNLSEDETKG